jgi:hypothetical protein
MQEKVVRLQSAKLDQLAGKIRNDIERRAKSEAEWVEATLDLCADLAEARATLPDDIGFGQWFDSSGFELNKNDRAAAISMGEDLVRAREVLTVTKSRSLQLIYNNEFRFPNARKPTTEDKPRSKIQTRGPTKKEQAAFAAYDQLEAALETVTRQAVAREAGVSNTIADKVIAARRAASAQPLPELSMTAQQKLEAWQKKLEAEFEYRVRQASMQWLDEVRIPIYEKKLADIERMFEWPRNAVMTKPEYRAIMRCLHPDSLNSRTEEQLAEAFRLFTHYKPKLIRLDEDERREVLSGLPRTREELLARKKDTQS